MTRHSNTDVRPPGDSAETVESTNGNGHAVKPHADESRDYRRELFRQMYRDLRLSGTADPFFNRTVRSRRT